MALLPGSGQPLLLAEIRLAPGHEPTSWERELAAAIGVRRTNREPFSGQAVPPGIRADLAEAAREEGAILHFPGHDEAVRLLRLAADAERAQLADPAYRAELVRWAAGSATARVSRTARWVRPPRRRRAGPGVLPRPAPPRYAWFEEHPQLAVLSTRAAGPDGWLAAGQALERVWLTATSRGISVSPLTQPLETAAAWLVRDARWSRAPADDPAHRLRAAAGPGAPRRPLGEVLDGPLPDEP